MGILLFFAVLTAVVSLLAIPLFDGVLGIALVTPLLGLVIAAAAQLLGIDCNSLPMQRCVYVAAIGIGFVSALVTFGRNRNKRDMQQLYPLLVLFIIFSGAYYASSQLWPDFIPLGERLRDYSLIVSAIHSPFVAQESWMEGTPLNYYVFWYRFAAMLHALTGMEVWNIYHASVALAVALYGAVCFQVLRVVFKAGVSASLLSALLIPFGSNVMGIARLTRTEGGGWGPDFGWWGASRVTRGAITEFPAWSFILGDAHPHYLNLVGMPFLFLLLYRSLSQQASRAQVVLQSVGIVVAGAMFLFGANAWEVPMWLGVSAAVVVMRYYSDIVAWCGSALRNRSFGRLTNACTFLGKFLADSLQRKRSWMHMSLWVLILIALKLNYFHIIPDAGKLSRVHEPIAVTTTAEFLYHWGAHLVVLALGVLFLAPCVTPVFVLAGACVLALFYDKAGALMLLLFVVTAIQGLMRSEKGTEIRWSDACTYALLLSGLGLVLIPEFVFLDDAYGGPDERMNTIFKSYTTAWGLLGLGCSALVVRAWRHSATCPAVYKFSERLVLSVVVVAYVVGTVYPGSGAAFGFYGPILRQRVMADAPESGVEGLGQVDRDKPGAAALIRTLRGLPRGRVLESQGSPYSYTTFISTLAAQPSYLGWANHLHLLSKVVGEVDRRIGVTSRVYSSDSCLERRELARSELIRYIVVGSNERAQHPELTASDFDCFEKLTETGDYLLYGVGS